MAERSKSKWKARRLAGLSLIVMMALPTAAEAQSVLSMLANSMNHELPRRFGNHTRLMKVAAAGDTLGFDFEVAPESPLARGLDVKGEAAKLCKVEMFRSLMSVARAKLRVTYRRPDKTPLGEFTIDRSICGS